MTEALPKGLLTHSDAITADIERIDSVAIEDIAQLWKGWCCPSATLVEDTAEGNRVGSLRDQQSRVRWPGRSSPGVLLLAHMEQSADPSQHHRLHRRERVHAHHARGKPQDHPHTISDAE